MSPCSANAATTGCTTKRIFLLACVLCTQLIESSASRWSRAWRCRANLKSGENWMPFDGFLNLSTRGDRLREVGVRRPRPRRARSRAPCRASPTAPPRRPGGTDSGNSRRCVAGAGETARDRAAVQRRVDRLDTPRRSGIRGAVAVAVAVDVDDVRQRRPEALLLAGEEHLDRTRAVARQLRLHPALLRAQLVRGGPPRRRRGLGGVQRAPGAPRGEGAGFEGGASSSARRLITEIARASRRERSALYQYGRYGALRCASRV